MLVVMGDLTTAEVLCCGVYSALKMCIFTLFAGTAGLDPLCLLMLLSKGSSTNLFQAVTNLAM